MISLLRVIAYHVSRARSAEERNLEESLRYHEASVKDAAELLALYEKRWPGEAAAGRLEYAEAIEAEAGNYPTTAAQVAAGAEKTAVRPERGSSPPSRKRRVPFSEPEAADRRKNGGYRPLNTLQSGAEDMFHVADEYGVARRLASSK